MKADESHDLSDAIRGGDRRALARAITLVESTRSSDREAADRLLDELLHARPAQSIRVGISGAPGVGKSSLIEALGLHAISSGRRLAVLAVDPSSGRSGGSILGDKTRMEALARSPDAYIRPSPSGGALGGLAPRTREAMLVCEAAGFDTILVETVGVGQSETEVDNIVDVFTLLVSPGGGDELQGMKRGVMELADLVVVTKADGDLLPAARQAAADYRHALHLFRPKHASVQAEVLTCSAIKGDGIPELWTALVAMHGKLEASGELAQIRAEQSSAWLWVEVRERLVAELRARPGIEELVRDLEDRVRAGTLTPTAAAEELLRARE